MEDVNYKKRLDAAWAEFNQELESKGIALPGSGGALKFRNDRDKTQNALYLDDIDVRDRGATKEKITGFWDKLMTGEQETLARIKLKGVLDMAELDVFIRRGIYKQTYEEIAEQLGVAGGASMVSRIHKEAMRKLEKIYA